MTQQAKIISLSLACLLVIAIYMLIDVGSNWGYILPRRGWRLAAIILTGGCIAISTVIFQTITTNRILTPNMIGMDSMYMLVQTAVVYFFGSASKLLVDTGTNFMLTLVLMLLFTAVLYHFMFRKRGSHIYYLLLVGVIVGTLLGSLTTFMQVLIDPNEFLVLQGSMFATYSKVQGKLVVICAVIVVLALAYYSRYAKYMDVMSLGKEHAVNLGVSYENVVKHLLMVVAALIASATALVGPMTFLGLLVANLTYQLMGTYRHSVLLPASVLVSVVALVGGQLLMERVFEFQTPLAVIINLIGGIYFLYFLLKENKA
jgi:iron complex transport system permease protein